MYLKKYNYTFCTYFKNIYNYESFMKVRSIFGQHTYYYFFFKQPCHYYFPNDQQCIFCQNVWTFTIFSNLVFRADGTKSHFQKWLENFPGFYHKLYRKFFKKMFCSDQKKPFFKLQIWIVLALWFFLIIFFEIYFITKQLDLWRSTFFHFPPRRWKKFVKGRIVQTIIIYFCLSTLPTTALHRSRVEWRTKSPKNISEKNGKNRQKYF